MKSELIQSPTARDEFPAFFKHIDGDIVLAISNDEGIVFHNSRPGGMWEIGERVGTKNAFDGGNECWLRCRDRFVISFTP